MYRLISTIDPLGTVALCSRGGGALKTRGSVWFPRRSYINGAQALPPRRSSLHLSCNCIVLSLNQYLQQLLKLKGKNRFAESSPGGFLRTPGGRCGSQSTYRKWGGKVFEGLIDELSQHDAHPLRLHQTGNFLFVQDSPDPHLLWQWKHTVAPNLHMYKVSIWMLVIFWGLPCLSYHIYGLTWRLFIDFDYGLCCCHPVSAGFQATVCVSKASKCQCLDIGDLKDTFSLFLFSLFFLPSLLPSNHSANTFWSQGKFKVGVSEAVEDDPFAFHSFYVIGAVYRRGWAEATQPLLVQSQAGLAYRQ